MAEFSMRVSSKFFCKFDHIFNSLVRTVCSCMVDIDSFKLNVERRHIESIEAFNVLPDNVNLFLGLLWIKRRLSRKILWKVREDNLFFATLGGIKRLRVQIFLHLLLEEIQLFEKVLTLDCQTNFFVSTLSVFYLRRTARLVWSRKRVLGTHDISRITMYFN